MRKPILVLIIAFVFAAPAQSLPIFAGLDHLAGGSFFSQALGVSADGSVVVVLGFYASDTEAIRWDPANEMLELDMVMVALGLDLAGGTLMEAFGRL